MEPTTGFDPSARREFWTMLDGDLRSAGTSFVDDALQWRKPAPLRSGSRSWRPVASVAEALRRHSVALAGATTLRFSVVDGLDVGPCRERPALVPTCKGKSPRRRWPTPQPSCFECCSTSSARASSWFDFEVFEPTLGRVFSTSRGPRREIHRLTLRQAEYDLVAYMRSARRHLRRLDAGRFPRALQLGVRWKFKTIPVDGHNTRRSPSTPGDSPTYG